MYDYINHHHYPDEFARLPLPIKGAVMAFIDHEIDVQKKADQEMKRKGRR